MSCKFPLLLLVWLSCSFRVLAQAATPNIVLILADDMGYGDLGCYGQRLISTPHLDSLARAGIRFTQFYAGCPVCAPSRSVLLTGMHSGHTPIRGNLAVKPEGQWPLPDTVNTLAALLEKAGYRTGAFGKWGLGGISTVGDPVKRGFQEFFGYNSQTLAHNYYPDHLWWNDTRMNLPNTFQHFSVYSARLIQDSALAFITRNKSKPFFLFLPYTLPHAALQMPDDSLFESYKKAFDETPVPVPSVWDGKGYAPQAYPRAAYATMVTRLDDYVGELMQRLRSLGLLDNTLVIFTSDNGPHHEGGNDPAFFHSSGIFRGVKRDVYEGGIREPMICAWKGHIAAGVTSDFVGAFWDFMPTIIALTDAPAPVQHMDGLSFLPTLLGDTADQAAHRFLYWEFHETEGKQAVRMGRWKGDRVRVDHNPDAPIELYDLDTDPGERHDVSREHPRIVAEIKHLMDSSHVESPLWPFFGDMQATDSLKN
jgi:arylsulfatase A-like enzyme